jgi:hypothetical protein
VATSDPGRRTVTVARARPVRHSSSSGGPFVHGESPGGKVTVTVTTGRDHHAASAGSLGSAGAARGWPGPGQPGAGPARRPGAGLLGSRCGRVPPGPPAVPPAPSRGARRRGGGYYLNLNLNRDRDRRDSNDDEFRSSLSESGGMPGLMYIRVIRS